MTERGISGGYIMLNDMNTMVKTLEKEILDTWRRL